MKRLLYILVFCTYFFNAEAAIDVGVDINTYFNGNQPYIEMSLHIISSTVNHKDIGDGHYQSKVDVLITVLNEKNDSIWQDNYQLISPKSTFLQDFLDLKRISLNQGNYVIHLELVDALDQENQFSEIINIEVQPITNEFQATDIKLLANVVKSTEPTDPFYKYGYSLEPAAFGFYHRQLDKLYYYIESYNTNKLIENDYATKASIVLYGKETEEIATYYNRYVADSVNVMIDGFSIKDLPSGNYKLIVDFIDRSKKPLYSDTIEFTRSNPIKDTEILLATGSGHEGGFVEKLDDEELEYALKALSPRLSSEERGRLNSLLSENNIKGQRYFLFEYWATYDPVNTHATFDQYMEIAKAVDRKFYSTYGRGFETDRGYIFLKYGKPDNVINVEDEPSAPPYEIWFYDRVALTGQSNVKFLFYNPNLGAYHYELLHSTARGERFNKQWEIELYRKAPGDVDGNVIDATHMKDGFNRRAREYFQDNN